MTSNPVTAQAKCVIFKLHDIFPPDKPMSVPLLRLMAATNDARHLQFIMVRLYENQGATEAERLARYGEGAHIYRLLCGHLYEAGIAFRDLDARCADEIDTLIAHEAGKAAIARLREIYKDTSANSLNKAVLKAVRDLGAFHYKHEKFREALETSEQNATWVIADFAGLSRYAVTDSFAVRIMAQATGGAGDKFQEKMTQLAQLAGTLSQAVDHLLLAIFKNREEAILEQREETIEIPTVLRPAIAAMRQREQI